MVTDKSRTVPSTAAVTTGIDKSTTKISTRLSYSRPWKERQWTLLKFVRASVIRRSTNPRAPIGTASVIGQRQRTARFYRGSNYSSTCHTSTDGPMLIQASLRRSAQKHFSSGTRAPRGRCTISRDTAQPNVNYSNACEDRAHLLMPLGQAMNSMKSKWQVARGPSARSHKAARGGGTPSPPRASVSSLIAS